MELSRPARWKPTLAGFTNLPSAGRYGRRYAAPAMPVWQVCCRYRESLEAPRFKEICDTAPDRATAEQQLVELGVLTESLGLDFSKFWKTCDHWKTGILNEIVSGLKARFLGFCTWDRKPSCLRGEFRLWWLSPPGSGRPVCHGRGLFGFPERGLSCCRRRPGSGLGSSG